jgi:ribosome biogenesis GTPase A
LQIVDARNPLLYRSQDLEAIVLETDSTKQVPKWTCPL